MDLKEFNYPFLSVPPDIEDIKKYLDELTIAYIDWYALLVKGKPVYNEKTIKEFRGMLANMLTSFKHFPGDLCLVFNKIEEAPTSNQELKDVTNYDPIEPREKHYKCTPLVYNINRQEFYLPSKSYYSNAKNKDRFPSAIGVIEDNKMIRGLKFSKITFEESKTNGIK